MWRDLLNNFILIEKSKLFEKRGQYARNTEMIFDTNGRMNGHKQEENQASEFLHLDSLQQQGLAPIADTPKDNLTKRFSKR